jgi:antitoxin component of MazEF toxin-antitoxin module
MNINEEKDIRILSVTGQSTYLYQEAPTIRLHGKWLGKLGFRIGQKVVVEQSHGHLTISILGKEKGANQNQAVQKVAEENIKEE